MVLSVNMHCVGCAKNVERCLMKCREVEDVEVDTSKNQVIVKGIVPEPQALCMRIHKKNHRTAKVVSLMPTNGDPAQPQLVPSQVQHTPGGTSVVLETNMHCHACADHLKRKILKMKGVQSAETELGTGKVVVTGTMDGNRLVDFIHRRSGKLAKIVSRPDEQKPQADLPKEPVKPYEEGPKEEEKQKEENVRKKEEEEREKVPEERGEESKAEKSVEPVREELVKEGEENYYYNYDGIEDRLYRPPIYMVEPVPPDQLFSDETPFLLYFFKEAMKE